MFCNKCGYELKDGMKFCPKCGQKIEIVEKKEPEKQEYAKTDSEKVVNQEKGIVKNSGLDNSNKEKKKNSKKIYIIIAIVLMLLIAILLFIKKDELFNNDVAYDRIEIIGDETYDNNASVNMDGAVDNSLSGWQQDAIGRYYYVDKDGSILKDCLKEIDGVYYYFNPDGFMLGTSFFKCPSDNTRIMYANSDGSVIMQKGFYIINGKVYYFDENGYAVINDWVYVDGAYYFMGEDGVLCKNRWINDEYYVGSDGKMYINAISPEGYILGSDGKIDYQSREKRDADRQAVIVAKQKEYDVSKISERIQEATIAKETLDFTDVESFDIVQFGRYEQDNNTANGKELVDWIVLEKDAINHRALLWSKYIIDKPTSYTNISSWLDSFYNNAFTQAERNIILKSNFDNGGSRFVSIISGEELKKYYFYDPDTQLYYNCGTSPTAYAKARGVDVYSANGHGGHFYTMDGRYLRPSGWSTSKDKVGIRPCLWVSYSGTTSSKVNPDTKETSIKSNDLSISSYETVTDEFYWGEDEKEVAFSFKKPIFNGEEEMVDNLTNAIDEIFDSLYSESENIVSNSEKRIKKITFSEPKITSNTSTRVKLTFDGKFTYQDSSNNITKKYEIVYDKNEMNYDFVEK